MLPDCIAVFGLDYLTRSNLSGLLQRELHHTRGIIRKHEPNSGTSSSLGQDAWSH